LEDRTIFLSIASYRDFECRTTVESVLLSAKYPHRIRIGVVDQVVPGHDVACDEPVEPCDVNPHQGLCLYKDQVEVYTIHASLSVGPVFARHLAYRLYRGEYYATQSDAHVTYTKDWDVDMVGQFVSAKNEMAVLSTYLSDIEGALDEQGNSKLKTRPIMCNTIWEQDTQGKHLRHDTQPEKRPSIHGTPQLSPWWAAGFSFSRGHFVVNVPYDLYQPMVFQGEEMSIGIRGFTVGYDFYAPERSVCFHHYTVHAEDKRKKVPMFWENTNIYQGKGKTAMMRLLGIVRMNPEIPTTDWNHAEEDMYGLGGVRTPEKFYETFGIDVVQKTIHNLCPFVDAWDDPHGGHMHEMFAPMLRADGMGLDYDQIHYRYEGKSPKYGQGAGETKS
jgi:[Skp1-protein]-hydroxyproline N-acetylglucosaminyltransferase